MIAMAVFQFEHFRTVGIPPSRFMPDFSRLHDGHHDFLGADAVHFFPDNGFDFQFHPPSQGQKGIEAAAVFADHTGFQHILMAGDFCFCRDFAQRRAI